MKYPGLTIEYIHLPVIKKMMNCSKSENYDHNELWDVMNLE